MKNTITHLETENGTKYPMIFTLNVMEMIQDKYETLDKWTELVQGKKEPNIKALKFGLGAMINEGIDIENEEKGTERSFIDDKKVGRIITELGILNVAQKIGENVVDSAKTTNSKNV